MVDLAALFARMLVIGLAIAAPVGAMGVLCIQRTIARGWTDGFVTGLGIATADAMFAAVAALGITVVADALVSLQGPLRLIGGAVLLWLGWRALRSTPPTRASGDASVGFATVTSRSRGRVRARDYTSAVGLTLANPATIIAFAAIFASSGLMAQPGLTEALVATIGIAVGSLLWWIALTTFVAVVRHALSPRALLWVNRVSGVMLLTFGAVAIVSGVTLWLR